MKKIIIGAELDEKEIAQVREIAAAVGILPETAKLIYTRGYRTEADVRRFLAPGKKNFHDPYLLKGMRESIDRLRRARDNGETVLIYGDYDADGISACTIMYRALSEYGINAVTAIPERVDGYGLNKEILANCAEEYFYDLVLTVDCGISDREAVSFIVDELGADVIVTDHHEIPEQLPDTVVIDPKLPDQDYPFDGLCGAGVALKVAYALLGSEADKFLDLAALATVADSMPLIGENRDIVSEGLKIFSSRNLRLAYRDLLEAAGAKEITSQALAYYVAPRVNAAGRMGDAAAALRLFLSDDEQEIFELAALLTSYNIERQNECDSLYRQARQMIAEDGALGNVIMLIGKDWRVGLIGIVASKISEEYNRPVIIFTGEEILKGSARSIEGVSIFEALVANKQLLEGFGGHAQAAGVSVRRENFAAFYAAMDEYFGKNYDADAFTPRVYVEGKLDGAISERFAGELRLLEPCGFGNRRPVYVTEVGAANASPLKPQSPNISFRTDALNFIYFGGGSRLDILNMPLKKRIIFEPSLDIFNNRKYVRGIVRDCLPEYCASEELDDYVFDRELDYLTADEVSAEEADDEEIEKLLARKYGVAIIFCDPRNLEADKRFASLPVGMFAPNDGSLATAVLIAPREAYGYDTLVYMDAPPRLTVGGKRTLVSRKVSGRRLFGGLTLDRSAFAEAFAALKKLSGRKFAGATDFVRVNFADNRRQTAFCLRVFMELGIFFVKDGVFEFDRTVRSDLKKSLIYVRTEEILANG